MLEKVKLVEERYEELNQLMADPETVTDHVLMAEYAQEQAAIEELVQAYRRYEALEKQLDDTRELLEMEEDADMHDMAEQEIARLEGEMEALYGQMRLLLLPKDPRDEKNVIVEIRAGTGGDEAGLFAADLYRMYTRYAEAQHWKTDILSFHDTGVGGYKEIIFEVKGKAAYSRLKYESGVHRVQRVPATEAQGRIHTSTATVAVLPEIEEVEIEIDPDDLHIDVYGSSGPGGQHMQKNAADHAQAQRHGRLVRKREEPDPEQTTGDGRVARPPVRGRRGAPPGRARRGTPSSGGVCRAERKDPHL
jgi:peptide chain release factor 1